MPCCLPTALLTIGSTAQPTAQSSWTARLVGGPFLGFLRLRWQLQHRCLLSLYQGCQKNDFAVWEFQRVVVGGPLVLVDLSEDRGPVADHRFVPGGRPPGPPPNVVREGQLSARKQTNCHPFIFGCAEAPCAQIEDAGGELIADLRRPGPNSMKAEISHRVHSSRAPAQRKLSPLSWPGTIRRADCDSSTAFASISFG